MNKEATIGGVTVKVSGLRAVKFLLGRQFIQRIEQPLDMVEMHVLILSRIYRAFRAAMMSSPEAHNLTIKSLCARMSTSPSSTRLLALARWSSNLAFSIAEPRLWSDKEKPRRPSRRGILPDLG